MIFRKNWRDSDFIPKIFKIFEFWKHFSAILLGIKDDLNRSIFSSWAFAWVEILAKNVATLLLITVVKIRYISNFFIQQEIRFFFCENSNLQKRLRTEIRSIGLIFDIKQDGRFFQNLKV